MSEITDLQQPLAAWLTREGMPFVQSRSDRESTIRKGWPDFTICKNGAVLLIECKGKDTPTTAEQIECHQQLRAAGNVVVVARSLATALEAIQTWQSCGMVKAAALDPSTRDEWGIAQDGTNGDFVYHRTGKNTWAKNRRANAVDHMTMRRIHLQPQLNHQEPTR